MFDLTTYPKKQEIPQLKTVFSTLDTLCLGTLIKWSTHGPIQPILVLFYSLLSCWVRTRVVAISLMKLTFPAACFLHVKNSCNWRNYLGQKLRVNTNLSSAYFVNIFSLVQVHSFIQIAKVIRRLANATAICIPEKRTHPSRLFLQTWQKSVGG